MLFSVLNASPSSELLGAQADVSPELLEALGNKDLSPSDIEIVKDEDGKGVIRFVYEFINIILYIAFYHLFIF